MLAAYEVHSEAKTLQAKEGVPYAEAAQQHLLHLINMAGGLPLKAARNKVGAELTVSPTVVSMLSGLKASSS